MFDNEESLGTQDVVDDVDSQEGSQGTPDGNEGNEPFLVVDERTQYKTREEAQRAYSEAGKRIASLSGWEKEMKQYGISDPRQAAQLMKELVERRQKEAAAKSSPENQNKGKNATISDDDLSEADQKALKWLQKMAPRLGYVPQSDLQALKDEIAQMQQAQQSSVQQSNEARFNDLVDSGRSEISRLMKDAKLPLADKRASSAIENYVRAYIDADDERVERFYKGGAELKSVIKEAFDEFSYVYGLGKQQKSADYLNDKTQAINRNKSLPNVGSGKKPVANAPQKKAGITPDVHNKAWEIFQRSNRGGDEE